jgi:glycosyltransferase involved in cell wall biosynthesis
MIENNTLHNDFPAISVVMATYNGALFLEDQIVSIIRQDFPATEIIVCDDCSTDKTQYVLENYSQKGNLQYYINDKRLGVVENFKKAASLANENNYISFADQDDIWFPEKLSASISLLLELENKDLPCMVYSDPIVVDSEGAIKSQSFWKILQVNGYRHTLETVLFGNPVQGCTMLMNPTLARYISTIPADIKGHDAWLVLCAYTFGKAGIVQKPLMKYRQHQHNVTFSTSFRHRKRLTKIMEEILGSFKNKDSLFEDQFIFVQRFYDFFYTKIEPEKRLVFEKILRLKNKSYLSKKLAFRKAMAESSYKP